MKTHAPRYRIAARSAVVFVATLGICPLVMASSQRIDPHVQEITNPSPGISGEVVVPTSVMASLCGDGDGCRIRLTGRRVGEYDKLKVVFGTTSEDGTSWILTQGSGGGNGIITDGVSEVIVSISVGSGDVCYLSDSAVQTAYLLQAVPSGVPPFDDVDCQLRIDD